MFTSAKEKGQKNSLPSLNQKDSKTQSQQAQSTFHSDLAITVDELAQFLNLSSTRLIQMLKKKTPWQGGNLVPPQWVRPLVLDAGYEYPNKVVSVQMLKGGVAKTTTVLNIGLRAAMLGARVLLVDLDQQANLSFAMGAEDEGLPVWLDLVEKRKSIQDIILKQDPFLHLIPSGLNNSVVDRVLLNSNRNWALSVKSPIDEIRSSYDLILIDTAPAISALNTAVTIASDQIVLPMNPDKFAYIGMKKNRDEILDVARDFKCNIDLKILFTKFDARERFSHQFLEKMLEEFSQELMGSYVRTSSEVKKTIGSKKNLYQSKSGVAEDYDAVTKEILGFQ